jgi:signal peptidase II
MGAKHMFCFMIFVAVLIADVLTKLWAIKELLPIDTIPLREGVFHLTYVENRGAAFGIMQDERIFFIVMTVLILAAGIVVLFRYRNRSFLLNLAVTFISSGAIGNLIDRISRGFVVDFFDFRLIDFPVFNVADIFICVGAALLVIFILFFEDSSKKKESEENES